MQCKKNIQQRERVLVEEKHTYMQEQKELKTSLIQQQDRALNAERVQSDLLQNIEQKVQKRQETLLNDLRSQLASYEQEIKSLRQAYDDMDASHKRKQQQLVQRAEQVTTSYINLRKRRDYEIEGFANDIISLRRNIRDLEKSLLKFGPLEDRELVLLTIAQQTGKKADKIGKEISGLKGKVYGVESKLVNIM